MLSDWLNKQIISDLYLESASAELDFRILIEKRYNEVEAAGGLVVNGNKEMLFIYRSGYWDLPKGHVEANESFEETAVREVEEETGLSSMQLIEELTVTRHFYFSHGKWEIKKTKWFLMTTEDGKVLNPQFSEGIEKAEWISFNRLESVLNQSFRSVCVSLEPFMIKFLKP